jgi:hypothetical protein
MAYINTVAVLIIRRGVEGWMGWVDREVVLG